jgi:hypothetical protein
MRPKTLSKTHRKHLSDARKGKPLSEEHRKHLSESLKGRIFSEETRNKMSVSQKGKKRSPLSKDLCKKLSESRKGENNPFFGKKHTEKTCKILSDKHKERLKLHPEQNSWWKGGISFEPYCPKFNRVFKERVRKFFNHTCQLCGHVWQLNEKLLSVHHVNYDKMVCCNDVKPLFVPLCDSCNSKVNFHREFWEEIFTNLILLEYDGDSF